MPGTRPSAFHVWIPSQQSLWDIHFTEEKQGTEKLNKLSKVKQLISSMASIQKQAVWVRAYALNYHVVKMNESIYK